MRARTARSRRARADLEALVETCPVGVVVLDAATGALASFNREARRITAGLISPELPVERARTAFAGAGGRHAVVIDLPPDLPRVMADAGRIVQVLDNLLSNAARHSPEAAPIRVAAEPDGAHVAVSVADSGEGVPPERLPHLFRRHAGIEEGGAGGSGLGLVICRGLVEAHGGRIRAESAGPGRASPSPSPCRRRRIRPPLPLPRPSPGTGGAGPPSCVVDDDPHALRQMRDALAAAGYEPVTAAGPGEVARLVETRHPALAVLDLVLPGADGIELMRTLPALADLPVIFVSAYGRGETIAQALEAGAADYVVKPFSPAELVARVGVALNRHAARGPFVLGDLAIDRVTRRVTVAGRPVRLTANRVQDPAHALPRRRWGDHLGDPPAPGVGRPGQRQPGDHAQRHPQAARQARRRREEPQVHRERAWPRLPYARAGRRVRPEPDGSAAPSAPRRRPAASHGVRRSNCRDSRGPDRIRRAHCRARRAPRRWRGGRAPFATGADPCEGRGRRER